MPVIEAHVTPVGLHMPLFNPFDVVEDEDAGLDGVPDELRVAFCCVLKRDAVTRTRGLREIAAWISNVADDVSFVSVAAPLARLVASCAPDDERGVREGAAVCLLAAVRRDRRWLAPVAPVLLWPWVGLAERAGPAAEAAGRDSAGRDALEALKLAFPRERLRDVARVLAADGRELDLSRPTAALHTLAVLLFIAREGDSECKRDWSALLHVQTQSDARVRAAQCALLAVLVERNAVPAVDVCIAAADLLSVPPARVLAAAGATVQDIDTLESTLRSAVLAMAPAHIATLPMLKDVIPSLSVLLADVLRNTRIVDPERLSALWDALLLLSGPSDCPRLATLLFATTGDINVLTRVLGELHARDAQSVGEAAAAALPTLGARVRAAVIAALPSCDANALLDTASSHTDANETLKALLRAGKTADARALLARVSSPWPAALLGTVASCMDALAPLPPLPLDVRCALAPLLRLPADEDVYAQAASALRGAESLFSSLRDALAVVLWTLGANERAVSVLLAAESDVLEDIVGRHRGLLEQRSYEFVLSALTALPDLVAGTLVLPPDECLATMPIDDATRAAAVLACPSSWRSAVTCDFWRDLEAHVSSAPFLQWTHPLLVPAGSLSSHSRDTTGGCAPRPSGLAQLLVPLARAACDEAARGSHSHERDTHPETALACALSLAAVSFDPDLHALPADFWRSLAHAVDTDALAASLLSTGAPPDTMPCGGAHWLVIGALLRHRALPMLAVVRSPLPLAALSVLSVDALPLDSEESPVDTLVAQMDALAPHDAAVLAARVTATHADLGRDQTCMLLARADPDAAVWAAFAARAIAHAHVPRAFWEAGHVASLKRRSVPGDAPSCRLAVALATHGMADMVDAPAVWSVFASMVECTPPANQRSPGACPVRAIDVCRVVAKVASAGVLFDAHAADALFAHGDAAAQWAIRRVLVSHADTVLERARLSGSTDGPALESLVPFARVRDALPSSLPALEVFVSLAEGADDGALFAAYSTAFREHVAPAVLPRVLGALGWLDAAEQAHAADPAAAPDYDACDVPPVAAAAHLAVRMLKRFPAGVRAWAATLPRSAAVALERAVARLVAPALIDRELARARTLAAGLPKGDALALRVESTASRRAIAVSYAVEDGASVGLALLVPPAFPLAAAAVEPAERLGVPEAKWRAWLLAVHAIVAASDAPLATAVRRWRDDVDKSMAGVEPCAVCYCVLHASDRALPGPACRTCKHRFHSGCLYRWFKTSGGATCPMCRSLF